MTLGFISNLPRLVPEAALVMKAQTLVAVLPSQLTFGDWWEWDIGCSNIIILIPIVSYFDRGITCAVVTESEALLFV